MKVLKIKDIRVFDLTANPTMDTDFTNLTATQLNALYPIGYDESSSNLFANDCTINNVNNILDKKDENFSF